MKSYYFEYDGSWMGGHLILVHTDEKEARKLAKKIVKAQKYDPDSVVLKDTRTLSEGSIIYNWDGDY